MGCKVTMSLVSERQDGPIGDDWKYEVEAKVFNEGLKGKGTIKVPKHNLPGGVTQEPPGPPDPVTMEGGDAGGTVLVRLHVKATEVDMFISDKGEASVDITLKSPGPGEAPISKESEISVGVRESPGISGETSIFRVVVRLEAVCE
ncbi:MAG: hypothetical protein V2I57_09560 [Xanthomonadales bacterium]|jgi:hypothetical protein|nr:hypothetical protein [Xanthomonadales bacterium]